MFMMAVTDLGYGIYKSEIFLRMFYLNKFCLAQVNQNVYCSSLDNIN